MTGVKAFLYEILTFICVCKVRNIPSSINNNIAPESQDLRARLPVAMEDIQSWWEVPCIAHFCSIFRDAFDLLEFEIEDFEEALIVDSTQNDTSLLDHLVTRLLAGCLDDKDVTPHNYDEYLRNYVVHRWNSDGKNAEDLLDTAFKFVSLRLKVEILHSLCEYRLEADDVPDCVKSMDGESLRMEPIGEDETGGKYWYFYGTRLYREAADKSILQSKQQRVIKSEERKNYCPRVAWTVVCRTETDWQDLANKFNKSKNMKENDLGESLSESLDEIKRISLEKEKTIRKRLIAMLPKRVSSRIEGIKKQERDATQTRESEQKALAAEQEKQQQSRQENERRLQSMKRRGERMSMRMQEKEGTKVLRNILKI